MPSSGIIVNRNNFAAYGEQVNQRVAKVVRDTAYAIVDRARELAPVDTGALRESIYAVTDTQSEYGMAAAHAQALRPEIVPLEPIQPVGPYEAGVGIAAPYWLYLEFGTMNRPARPFLTPAVEETRPKFEQGMAEALEPNG
jgi:HK97 gp10 family phage protein